MGAAEDEEDDSGGGREAAKLKRANEKLRSELELLKQLVEDLREKRSQQEEAQQHDDDSTDELMRLENELLRAQLLEQKAFLKGCQQLMRAMPELHTTAAPSSSSSTPGTPMTATPQSRAELLKQGQENSITHLLLLVSRSQTANDWQAVQLPPHVFTTGAAVPGFNVTCNFRKEAASICLRVDGCFPNIPPETVASGYWRTWTSERFFEQTFGDFFKPSQGPTTKEVPVPFVIKQLLQSEPAADDASSSFEETKVNVYREMHAKAATTRDWIYCLTKVKRELALSTLSLPPELNPSVATRRVQHTRKVVSATAPPRKRNKGCASSSQLMGRQECIILARSCLKDAPLSTTEDERDEGLRSVHAIDEEGLFVWQDEVSIDFEVKCDEGVELQRKRVPAARASAFISLSSTACPIQDMELFTNVVDSAGRATERYAKLVNAFYALMAKGEEEE